MVAIMRLCDQVEDIGEERNSYLNFYSLHPAQITGIYNPTITFLFPPPPAEDVYIDRTQTLLTWGDFFKATNGLPTSPPWAEQDKLEPTDQNSGSPTGYEYSR
eukprot:14327069-Heterocapsa_arctica.AAC.1